MCIFQRLKKSSSEKLAVPVNPVIEDKDKKKTTDMSFESGH